MKLDIWDFFENLSKNQVSLKFDMNKGYFTWIRVDIFLRYLAKFFLEWEMFQIKVAEKLKTHILYSFPPPKIDVIQTERPQITSQYGAYASHAG
jgi:hypothetical protein